MFALMRIEMLSSASTAAQGVHAICAGRPSQGAPSSTHIVPAKQYCQDDVTDYKAPAKDQAEYEVSDSIPVSIRETL